MRGASAISAVGDFRRPAVLSHAEKAGAFFMGEMKRANAREDEQRTQDRFASTIAICASIIAAVRLARDERIGTTSPRVVSVVWDSVTLAKAILRRVLGR